MLCVFWVCESRGWWPIDRLKKDSRLQTSVLIPPPTLSALVWVLQDIRTWAINHQKQNTWTSVSFYSANKSSSTRGRRGHVWPEPASTHRWCYDDLELLWLSAAFFVDGAVFTSSCRTQRRFPQSALQPCFVRQAEPKTGLCHKDNGIISPVFMDISVSRRLSHILCRRSARHRPNLTLWTGEKSHVMFSTRSRSRGAE